MRVARCGLLLGLAAALAGGTVAAPPAAPAARLRRPVAAAFLDDGSTLAVVNARSGTISLIDRRHGRTTAEVPVSNRLAGLVRITGPNDLLTIDEERHELLALATGPGSLRVVARQAVGPYPVSVAVLPGGRRVTVACLWSRRLEIVDVTPRLQHSATVRLPFPPREQCVLPDGRLVVADAFGGRLAVVDAEHGRLIAVHEFRGHNVRGLAVRDNRELLVAHQILDEKAPTTRENVERGVVMANVVRILPLDRLGEAGRTVRLGPGAGDPGPIVPLSDGRVAVALGGVDQVALIDPATGAEQRLVVGRRPTALRPTPDGQALIALATFDDSLAVIDTKRGAVTRTVALGPPAALECRDRGEQLFYDARLSRGANMSCHSCHTDGHTNGLLADTRGDGSYGTPKLTLTLLGSRLADPWGWNGAQRYLHDQIDLSLEQTMHAASVTSDLVGDLGTFLHTLPPPPPAEPISEDKEDRERADRGRRLFEERGCVRCHIPPLTYSSHGTHDVGFADENGHHQFKAPSLRGVGQLDRLLHDGRARSLEELFTRYRHKVGAGLSDDERRDLLRFLRSL